MAENGEEDNYKVLNLINQSHAHWSKFNCNVCKKQIKFVELIVSKLSMLIEAILISINLTSPKKPKFSILKSSPTIQTISLSKPNQVWW